MRKRRYSKEKILSLLMVPFLANSMAATVAFSADVGAGETLTLTGTNNTEQIIGTGDGATVILAEDATLVVVDGAEGAITLQGDSTITLTAGSELTSTGTEHGVYGAQIRSDVDGSTETITLDDAGIIVSANGSSYEDSTGINIRAYSEAGENTATVSLNHGSSIQADTIGGSRADALGVKVRASGEATVELNDQSAIQASATVADGPEGARAFAEGVHINSNDDSATVTLNNNSSVTVTANADAEEDHSRARSTGIYAVGESGVSVSIDNSSTVNTTATGDDAEARAIVADSKYGSDGATTVTIDNSSTVSAAATGDDAEATAIEAESNDGATTVTIDNSSTVSATATGNYAIATAIEAYSDDGATTVTIDNSSTVSATATGNYAYAVAIEADSENHTTVTIDNGSTVSATATSSDVDGRAVAVGLYAFGDGSSTITLSNNSHINAVAEGSTTYGAGILNYGESTGTITIDATSSIAGTDYAIIANAIVNNAGRLAGKLDITELNNSSTGILEMTLRGALADSEHNVDDNNNPYFDIDETASLANGTTFKVNVETFTGFDEVGDSLEINTLEAGTGDWEQAALNLTRGYNSPMLGLAWSENSTADNLITTFTFLNASQAGLSRNGTAAFNAAMEDGLFTFESSPEDWTPSVNGASRVGSMTTINSTQSNVEARLLAMRTGGTTGMSAGDTTILNGSWINIRHTNADKDSSSSIEGFDADSTSLTLGFDHTLNNGMKLGIAFSYGESDVDIDGGNEDYELDDYLLTMYGSYDLTDWYVEGQLSYGWGNIEGERIVGVDLLESDYDSNVYYARLTTGRDYQKSDWKITPKASLDYAYIDYDDYQETGGAMALDVDSENYSICNIGAGVQVERTWVNTERITISPKFSGMVYYDMIGDDIEAVSTFVGGTTSFVTVDDSSDDVTFNLTTGLEFGSLDAPHSFNIDYEYINRDEFESHTFTAKIRYEF